VLISLIAWTLRAIAGLDRDYSGDILLDGVEQRGPSARIGVIFQEPRLLPWLTVGHRGCLTPAAQPARRIVGRRARRIV
jgi:ABC-type nitrate/sulfonate/bicarbonate transport system ATPase subunit